MVRYQCLPPTSGLTVESAWKDPRLGSATLAHAVPHGRTHGASAEGTPGAEVVGREPGEANAAGQAQPRAGRRGRLEDASLAAHGGLLGRGQGRAARPPRSDDLEEDHVFLSRVHGPIDPDGVDRAFKRYLDVAGLPNIRFHDLRHTHASLLIAAGVHPKAIQARMGHASVTTTLNTYGHLMPNALEGVVARMDVWLKDQQPGSDQQHGWVSGIKECPTSTSGSGTGHDAPPHLR